MEIAIFIGRQHPMHAERDIVLPLPSVCLSNAGTVSKRMDLSTLFWRPSRGIILVFRALPLPPLQNFQGVVGVKWQRPLTCMFSVRACARARARACVCVILLVVIGMCVCSCGRSYLARSWRKAMTWSCQNGVQNAPKMTKTTAFMTCRRIRTTTCSIRWPW